MGRRFGAGRGDARVCGARRRVPCAPARARHRRDRGRMRAPLCHVCACRGARAHAEHRDDDHEPRGEHDRRRDRGRRDRFDGRGRCHVWRPHADQPSGRGEGGDRRHHGRLCAFELRRGLVRRLGHAGCAVDTGRACDRQLGGFAACGAHRHVCRLVAGRRDRHTAADTQISARRPPRRHDCAVPDHRRRADHTEGTPHVLVIAPLHQRRMRDRRGVHGRRTGAAGACGRHD